MHSNFVKIGDFKYFGINFYFYICTLYICMPAVQMLFESSHTPHISFCYALTPSNSPCPHFQISANFQISVGDDRLDEKKKKKYIVCQCVCQCHANFHYTSPPLTLNSVVSLQLLLLSFKYLQYSLKSSSHRPSSPTNPPTNFHTPFFFFFFF